MTHKIDTAHLKSVPTSKQVIYWLRSQEVKQWVDATFALPQFTDMILDTLAVLICQNGKEEDEHIKFEDYYSIGVDVQRWTLWVRDFKQKSDCPLTLAKFLSGEAAREI